MRGGAIPVLAWGTLLLVLFVGNWIWDNTSHQPAGGRVRGADHLWRCAAPDSARRPASDCAGALLRLMARQSRSRRPRAER